MTETAETDTAVKHDLVFFANRNTPKVLTKGKQFKAPKSYGKVTKRRPATADEEKKIAKGDWLRVDVKGSTPGKAGYKGGSNLRPALRKMSKDKADLDDYPVADAYLELAHYYAAADADERKAVLPAIRALADTLTAGLDPEDHASDFLATGHVACVPCDRTFSNEGIFSAHLAATH